MTELLPEDQALFDAARDGHEPTNRDRSRVRAALIAQLGVGAGMTVAANTSAAAMGPAGLAAASGAAAATKGLAAIAILAVLGGGGAAAYWVTRTPAAATVTQAIKHGPVSAPVAAPAREFERGSPPASAQQALGEPGQLTPSEPAQSAPTEPAQLAPVEPLGGELSRAAAFLSRPSASDTSARAPSSVSRVAEIPAEPSIPPRLASTTLENETRLVRGGIAALHAGDAKGALALFDEHVRRYPGGALAEERDAERVTALCNLGRNGEAASAAAAFLQTHPRSTLASRVGAICAPTNP